MRLPAGLTGLRAPQGSAAVPEAAVIPLAAGSAGVVLSFVLSPFELVKCRMQLGARGGHNYRCAPATRAARRALETRIRHALRLQLSDELSIADPAMRQVL